MTSVAYHLVLYNILISRVKCRLASIRLTCFFTVLHLSFVNERMMLSLLLNITLKNLAQSVHHDGGFSSEIL